MEVLLGIAIGFIAFLAIYCLLGGIYTVNQNERAVVTNFGKAERIGHQTTLSLPQAEILTAEERKIRVSASTGNPTWRPLSPTPLATRPQGFNVDPND